MDFETSLKIESWTLFVSGLFILSCRMFSRRLQFGSWKKLGIDDYLMIFAFINFTGVCVSINEVAKNGSNYMEPEVAAALTPEGVDRAVYGSIMTFVLELFTLTALWTVKACLLILYYRLTGIAATKHYWGVKVVAVYCVVTYLVTIILLLCHWCFPTYEYWAVPVRIDQCATYYNHMIFATACNVSSDLMLFLIPIPLVLGTSMKIKRKIILCCILGLGIFNILAAILNRYYNFTMPHSYIFLLWYVAEVGIAIWVGNMPLCYPLLRLVLGRGIDSTDGQTPPYDIDSNSKGNGRTPRRKLPRGLGVTTLGESVWDKLEEEEGHTHSVGSAGDVTRSDSDRDSQIELVVQKQSMAAADKGLRPEADHQVGTAVTTKATHRPSADDKIMVVTTFDISR